MFADGRKDVRDVPRDTASTRLCLGPPWLQIAQKVQERVDKGKEEEKERRDKMLDSRASWWLCSGAGSGSDVN